MRPIENSTVATEKNVRKLLIRPHERVTSGIACTFVISDYRAHSHFRSIRTKNQLLPGAAVL